ncbi:MAG: alginate export family protein [Methylacidiphilales bacterium]|nr:alginate export family protein [Candidatus Methylacidiphilales bacterium]
MNVKHQLLALCATAGFLLNPVLNADTTTEPTPKEILSQPTWKLGEPIQFMDGKLVFDAQERLRMEMRNNTFDFNDSMKSPQDDTFLLQRVRLGILYKPAEWLKFYASGQDSREVFSNRPNTPFVLGSEGDNTFNLREGNVEIGNLQNFPLSAKIGRQVLSYGDERLIGGFDWNNFGRTFDAAKITVQATQKLSIDIFAASVVEMEGYQPLQGDHTWQFNNSDPSHDKLIGVYATDKNGLVSFQQTEAYFLYRGKDGNDPNYKLTPSAADNFSYDVDQEVYCVGGRVKSTSPGHLKGFDYEGDFAYEFGTGGLPATGKGGRGLENGLTLSAFAAHAAAGYNWELAPWTPRLGLDYAVASGDSNPNDGKSESFMNLFPTNHKFYGYMDTFAWKNMHDPSINLTLKPNSKITLRLEQHVFFLYTNEDAWYRANAVTTVRTLNAAARNASTYVGQESDVTATYAYSKWLNFLVGYSHFWAGDYVRQTSPTRAQDDAEFLYVQTTLKF